MRNIILTFAETNNYNIMASTVTLYANSYKLNITEDFHKRFTALPMSKPDGKYTFVVWLEERKSWLQTQIFWCYKFINERNEVVHEYESGSTGSSLDSYFHKKAFEAELVNYASKIDCWEDWLFCSHNQEYKLSHFSVGDTLENSNFEVVVYFDSITFDWCLKRFKEFGIDTEKYDTYSRYKWVVKYSSAKLYYDNECIYNHPDPKYVLAVLGWFIAPNLRY